MRLFKRIKNTNKPLIRQILDLVPPWLLQNCIAKHNSDKGCSRYMTRDQFVAQSLLISFLLYFIGIRDCFAVRTA